MVKFRTKETEKPGIGDDRKAFRVNFKASTLAGFVVFIMSSLIAAANWQAIIQALGLVQREDLLCWK